MSEPGRDRLSSLLSLITPLIQPSACPLERSFQLVSLLVDVSPISRHKLTSHQGMIRYPGPPGEPLTQSLWKCLACKSNWLVRASVHDHILSDPHLKWVRMKLPGTRPVDLAYPWSALADRDAGLRAFWDQDGEIRTVDPRVRLSSLYCEVTQYLLSRMGGY